MDQPTAEHALRQLEPLVGEWTFEAKWPSGEPRRGGGRVTFEWHASGAHPLQRGTAELPEAPDNVSIIGCDPANGTYFQLYSDERGVCRIYEMSIGNQLASASTTTGTSNTGTRSPASGLSDSTPTRRREDWQPPSTRHFPYDFAHRLPTAHRFQRPLVTSGLPRLGRSGSASGPGRLPSAAISRPKARDRGGNVLA